MGGGTKGVLSPCQIIGGPGPPTLRSLPTPMITYASSTRAAENRSRWKGIVANSSVVRLRPSKVMG